MRYIKIYLFIFIFLIPKDVHSSEIQETIFASWNKSDVNLFYTLPDVINEETKVLFIIHGGSRNAYDYLKIWGSCGPLFLTSDSKTLKSST